MRVIIAGSRDVSDPAIVDHVIRESGLPITEVVSGGCRGVDTLGERWAMTHSLPVARFPANWHRFGRMAGPLRNSEMIAYAEAAIVVRYLDSKGSADLEYKARNCHMPVFTHLLTRPSC
jgi:hypothetical protein